MSEPEPFSPIAQANPKPFLVRLGLGFVLVYLLLYGLPFPLGQVPAQEDAWPIAEAVDWWNEQDTVAAPDWLKYPVKWKREVDEEVADYTGWFGQTVLGLEAEVKPASSGSGDTLFDWVRVALMLALALLAAPLFALVTGNRSLRWCHGFARVIVRYGLASTLCVYGFAKVYPLQFSMLHGQWLYGSFGEASPMNMLWTFMGSSDPYTIFSGAAELLGGLLLFWRRTTLLGALVAFGVMLNVATLNLCYDVPEKLFSLHMVLFSVLLVAPDLPRLWALLVSHRATPAAATPATPARWLSIPQLVGKLLIVAIIVGVPWHACHDRWMQMQNRPTGPLEGIWETREFDSQQNATRHWHHFAVQRWNRRGTTIAFASIETNSGELLQGRAEFDLERGKLRILRRQQPPLELTFEERSQVASDPDTDPVRQLILSGTVEGEDVRAVLEYRDESTFRIKSSPFRWIQERPFNANRR
ncbi:MAG: hypothetical protein NXI31_21480 [bacterium]|nr:hypothetical protein [bacterium]